MAALGEQAGFVVLAVAVGNWTIVELAKHLGIQRHRAHGRLAAGLERLREHYWPPREPADRGAVAGGAGCDGDGHSTGPARPRRAVAGFTRLPISICTQRLCGEHDTDL